MKFTCCTEHLKQAIAMLSRVVPAKPAKEILKAIKFTTGNGSVSIEGNDGENALRMQVLAIIDEAGAGLLEFSKLRPIVDSLIDGDTRIELAATSARILCGSSKFTLGCGRTDEFPAFPSNEGRTRITMNSGEWSDAIARLEPFSVPPAACNWRGVHIESSDDHGVYAVASNASGGCLGFQKLDAKIEGPDVKAFISEKGSKLMAAVLAGLPGDCTIRFSEAVVSVETPSGAAICRLNEGKFPQWRKFYNIKAKHEASCLREPLLTALQQVTIPLTDASRRVNFKFADNNLTMTAAVAGDEAEVEVPFGWDGDELELTYSGDLLRNVVGAFPGGSQLKMFLVADEQPIKIESGAVGFLVAGMESQR